MLQAGHSDLPAVGYQCCTGLEKPRKMHHHHVLYDYIVSPCDYLWSRVLSSVPCCPKLKKKKKLHGRVSNVNSQVEKFFLRDKDKKTIEELPVKTVINFPEKV